MNEHLLGMILHPKLKKFEIIIDERDKAIDLLKLEYAHERSMVSPMFVSLQPPRRMFFRLKQVMIQQQLAL